MHDHNKSENMQWVHAFSGRSSQEHDVVNDKRKPKGLFLWLLSNVTKDDPLANNSILNSKTHQTSKKLKRKYSFNVYLLEILTIIMPSQIYNILKDTDSKLPYIQWPHQSSRRRRGIYSLTIYRRLYPDKESSILKLRNMS